MTNPLSRELYIVGWCIVCGCVSGLWYDFFKSLRKLGINTFKAVGIQDVCFWVGEILLIYIIIYFANDGVLRWYEFFFMIFGFVLYRYLLSEYVVALYEVVIKVTLVSFRKLGFVVAAPFKMIKRFIKKYNKCKVARFIRRKFRKKP